MFVALGLLAAVIETRPVPEDVCARVQATVGRYEMDATYGGYTTSAIGSVLMAWSASRLPTRPDFPAPKDARDAKAWKAILVNLVNCVDRQGAKAYLDRTRSDLKGVDSWVYGIGEEAFMYGGSEAAPTSLYFRSGAYYISVSCRGGGTALRFAMAAVEALADGRPLTAEAETPRGLASDVRKRLEEKEKGFVYLATVMGSDGRDIMVLADAKDGVSGRPAVTGKNRLDIVVWVIERQDDAGARRDFAQRPGVRAIEGLGDEAVVKPVEAPNGEAATLVLLRLGRFVASVRAPGDQMAPRCARAVVEALRAESARGQ